MNQFMYENHTTTNIDWVGILEAAEKTGANRIGILRPDSDLVRRAKSAAKYHGFKAELTLTYQTHLGYAIEALVITR